MSQLSNNTRASVLVTAAALLLLAVSAQALLGRNIPSISCPLPLPLVALAFSGVPRQFVIAAPSLIFFVWCLPIVRGNSIPLRRTAFAAALVAVGSGFAFALGWHWGIEYQGYTYTLTTALLSLGLAISTAALLLASRRAPSLAISLAANLLLFAWAFTYAAPYLGELP